MCDKSNACGCSGGTSGVGTGPIWAPLWVVGAAIAVVLVVKTAEIVWPYALAGATVLAVVRAWLWQHRRKILARTVPVPDPVLAAAPGRTRVESVTVTALPAGMRKTPGLVKAGRRNWSR